VINIPRPRYNIRYYNVLKLVILKQIVSIKIENDAVGNVGTVFEHNFMRLDDL